MTTAHTTVAMNAATCALHWRHIDSTGQQEPISVNRAVAYLDGNAADAEDWLQRQEVG